MRVTIVISTTNQHQFVGHEANFQLFEIEEVSVAGFKMWVKLKKKKI